PHVGAYRLDIDIDVIVGPPWLAAEDACRCRVPQVVAASYDRITSGVVLTHSDPAVVHHRILHGDLDLLALPGGLPLPEGRQDAHDGVDTGAGVADSGARLEWWSIGIPGHGHGAASRLGNHVKAFIAAVWPVSAKALDGGVDQARVESAQGLI